MSKLPVAAHGGGAVSVAVGDDITSITLEIGEAGGDTFSDVVGEQCIPGVAPAVAARGQERVLWGCLRRSGSSYKNYMGAPASSK